MNALPWMPWLLRGLAGAAVVCFGLIFSSSLATEPERRPAQNLEAGP